MESERAIRGIVAELVDTWNAGDAEGFARHFADDADFINVQGMYDRGRATIAIAHRFILSTFYKGSRNEYAIERIRFLGENAAIVFLNAKLTIPAGNKEMLARPTMVVERRGDDWKIVAFQNTFIAPEAAAMRAQLDKFATAAG